MTASPTLRRTDEYREVLALSAPIAGVQLAQVALTSVDLAMLGMLGVTAVAAGGLAILLHNQIRTMCVGMVTGVGNSVAGAAAEGERRTGTDALDAEAVSEIRELVRSALLVGTLTAAMGAAVLAVLAFALPLFGQRAEVVAPAKAMILALAPGLFPMVWLNVLRQFAVGLRRPAPLLKVALVSIAVNAALNAVFIYGWAGVPKLGVAGVGLATTGVQVFTLAAFAGTLRRDPGLRPLLSLMAWRADPGVARAIARHGTPICFTYGSEAAITSIATLLMGVFGPGMLAASNVANQVAYIVYQGNIGLSQGSSILVSRARGKGDEKRPKQIERRVLELSWSFMAVISLAYVLIPHIVLWPFLRRDASAAALGVASALLLFAVVQQYSKGTQNIYVGLLRGMGDVKTGLRSTLIGYWGVGVPAMFVCAYGFGWGGWGVWTGLCAGFAVTAALLARAFHKRV